MARERSHLIATAEGPDNKGEGDSRVGGPRQATGAQRIHGIQGCDARLVVNGVDQRCLNR